MRILCGYLKEKKILEMPEIKGFLKWLEREIGAEIDSFANKTASKECHEHDFNQLPKILKKNRNKISIAQHGRNQTPPLSSP
ncbi:MAG: hypothetical protein NG747_08565 [Candidatus Brocadia sp.]|nr:hypothetical protein [Candidatus Brocadia sp.]